MREFKAPMHFSFIICTRNRASQLRRTLDSITPAVEAVPEHRFDLTLVDNGSTDETAQVFDAWAQNTTIKATRLYLERPGLSASRNLGVATAPGEILIFTDDDCVLSPTYCRELVAHLIADTEKRIIGGRVELGDATDIPFTIKVSRVGARLEGVTHPGSFVLGCNMIAPRSVLDQLGPFDERFGAGARYRSGEDTDMLYRAHRHGIAVEYVPDMVVHHFHGRKTEQALKQLNYAYHYGTGALYSKYLFVDPGFAKHLYWAARNAVRESWGGAPFEPGCNLSYWTVVKGNLAGLAAYAVDRVREAMPGSKAAERG
jgi:glycosyltransferase involved in cell wall biosynthesis